MNSRIYFGDIQHRRFSPKDHHFEYKLFMLYLDLDEIENIFKPYWFWSFNRFNLASFLTKDYIGNSDNLLTIKSSVQNAVETEYGVKPIGPIRMLTHLRYFGHCFNPVSFYYCFDEKNNKQINFVVAEINNTPWNQRFVYVLDNRDNPSSSITKIFEKEFHVSPFMSLDMTYYWRFSHPKDDLMVYMKNYKGQDKLFDATLKLKAKTISSKNLAKALFQYPLMSWKVSLGIYWQALKLWLKKIPFYSNPHTN